VREEPPPQYIYALALVLGGAALLLPELSPLLSRTYITFALLGAAFGFVWPAGGWRFGLCLTLPYLILILLQTMQPGGIDNLLSSPLPVALVLVPACVGSYLGARFSPYRTPF
jgi:hypothetical protein